MCKMLQLYTYITVDVTNRHKLNPTLQIEGEKTLHFRFTENSH